MTVGFAIPSIPPRARILNKAVQSVLNQNVPVQQINIAVDTDKLGAWDTRNRAKNGLLTEWTCFLDDDDELYPFHVASLLHHQRETGADLVFPYFDVVGGSDPFPKWFENAPWDPEAPRMFPITVMLRTELAQSLDFRPPEERPLDGEDWDYWKGLLAMGAVFSHCPQRTWKWVHGRNTSGKPDRW